MKNTPSPPHITCLCLVLLYQVVQLQLSDNPVHKSYNGMKGKRQRKLKTYRANNFVIAISILPTYVLLVLLQYLQTYRHMWNTNSYTSRFNPLLKSIKSIVSYWYNLVQSILSFIVRRPKFAAILY